LLSWLGWSEKFVVKLKVKNKNSYSGRKAFYFYADQLRIIAKLLAFKSYSTGAELD
jgi:hypothetical protein